MPNIFDKASLLARTSSYKYSYDSGWGAGSWIFWSFTWIGLYIYSGLTLMLIAKKTSTNNNWMAWVPILNFYLMCKIAGKSAIWIIFLFLPFINIIAVVLIWSAIAEKLGKPAWWGILMLVPIANFVIMGILAFSGSPNVVKKPKKAAAVSFSGQSGGGAICSQCGAEADLSDKFCPECGGKVVKKTPKAQKITGKFCPSCGAKIGTGAKFCPDCGAKT